jgi:hypothetical protein
LEPAACFVPYLLNNAGRGFMRWLSRCLAGIILVTLVSSAQAQFREQRSLVDWRTFEVPDFGTSVQYPASIFAPAGKPEKGVGQRFERPTDALFYPFTLVPTTPVKTPQPT